MVITEKLLLQQIIHKQGLLLEMAQKLQLIEISMEKLYGLLPLMGNQQHVLAQHIVKPIIQQAGN